MSKNLARGHKVEKHHPKERKKRTTYSPYKEETAMVQTIIGKSDIFKEIKGKKEKTHVAVRAPTYRRTIERRAAASMKV